MLPNLPSFTKRELAACEKLVHDLRKPIGEYKRIENALLNGMLKPRRPKFEVSSIFSTLYDMLPSVTKFGYARCIGNISS